MHRLVLLTDGNFNTGATDTAVDAAAAQGVPIDVVPLHYDVKSEVLVERFVAPSQKRENEPFTIDVVLRSTNPTTTTGKLTVLRQGQPMDLDPHNDGVQPTREVKLNPGRMSCTCACRRWRRRGYTSSRRFRGRERDGGRWVAGRGSPQLGRRSKATRCWRTTSRDVHLRARQRESAVHRQCTAGRRGALTQALATEGIVLDDRTGIDQFPNSVIELQNYDAVILANVPQGAGGLSPDQGKMLANTFTTWAAAW